MKTSFRFTLKLKFLIGFGILGLLLVMMYKTMSDTQKQNSSNVDDNLDLVYPSMVYTEKLKDLIMNSQYLVTKWTLRGNPSDKRLQSEIESCHGELYDSLRTQIASRYIDKDLWSDKNKTLYFQLTSTVDTLFGLQSELIDNLNTMDKFNDATNYSFRRYSVVEGDIAACYKRAFSIASRLSNFFYKASRQDLEMMDDGFVDSENTLRYSILVCLVFVILILVFLNYTVERLNYVKGKIKEMSEGVLPEVKVKGHDEIAEIADTLRTLVGNLKETSQFALRIGEGNFSTEFKPVSKHDVLANSLLVMRGNLIKADKEAEQRKIENSQRNWQAQGLAEFNEVLRNAGDDMQVLSNKVIERLVRYLDANMGGIYIVDDTDENDVHLELTAFYAYNRLKYVKQRIEIGENLVGQCFRENETVYMTDIPKGYVHISSGLGEADPTCLVIVPLQVNSETYGIVELASFQVIEKYQVEFIEKIGETIASTIANVKINMNTQKLLEESHQKGERLIQQEAEVHRTIDSLKAQIENLEDVNKREAVRYQKLHDDFENQAENNQTAMMKLNEKNEQLKDELMKSQFILNNSAGYYELDAQGFFISMNQRLLNSLDLHMSEIENHDIRSYMADTDVANSFGEVLLKLTDGLIHNAVHQYVFNGRTVYFNETFTPIRDEYNMLVKICVVSRNITNDIEKYKQMEQQLAECKQEIDVLQQKLSTL
ncbi:MAG: GAF domain-containing protein [Bacteroidales bacterium]|nr:GAF domain-containing protein [Bacteroidales bacterium]